MRFYCTKAQLILIVLSRATSLVFNGNNITSRVSLTMKMYQILSASATLSFRIGLIFCVFQGGSSKSEAKARKTRGKREKTAKRELSAKGASQKKSRLSAYHCSRIVFCTCTQLRLRARVISPLFVKIYLRKKLLVFGKLIISTTTANFETATKFDTVVNVKLAGFQW